METVCALYQFEIPCAETYLIDMGINRTALDLVSEGFLIKRRTYYYLHHPSVAKIYLDTLQHFHLLDDPAELAINALSSYLEKSKEERAQVFYKLSTFPKSLEKKALILEGILQQVKTEDLVNQVKQEENLEKIGFFFRSLSAIDQNRAKEILSEIGVESLRKKLYREPFIRKQKNLITDISHVDANLAKSLSEKRPIVALVLPLFNEEKQIPVILRDIFDFVDIAIVIDDGSKDSTGRKAIEMGAKVIRNAKSTGLKPALLTGLKEAVNQKATIVVIDMFPWINRSDIPNLIAQIMKQDADLVVGINKKLSEFIPEHLRDQRRGLVNKQALNNIQALNLKAVEKFLKYLPSEHFADINNLSITQILFSKMLKVKVTEIKMLLAPLEIAYHVRYPYPHYDRSLKELGYFEPNLLKGIQQI